MKQTFFKRKVEDLNAHGYSFEVMDYIQRGSDLFGKEAGKFVGFMVLIVLFYIAAAMLLLAPIISFLSLVFFILAPPVLNAGIYIVAHKADKEEVVEFSNFFDGSKHLKQLFLLTIVSYLIYFGIALIFKGPELYFITTQQSLSNSQLFSTWSTVGDIISLYLYVAYSFASFHIIFNDFQFWDALEASRKVLTKRWFHMALLCIMLFFINVIGFICIGLGLLVTVPITFCAIYAAFEDIVGTDAEELSEFDELAFDVDYD